MSRKQSKYSPRIDCQHRVGQADGTSKVITFSKKHGDTLSVNRGVIVGKHFMPADDNAKEDRQKQMDAPADYVKSSTDLQLLAGVLFREGWASSHDEAIALIVEDMEGGESADDLDKKEVDALLDKVCDDLTVDDMKKLLRDEGIAFHGRAKERSLAAKVIEYDLV